ncbi:hypothetical protein KIK06_06755 [Nocardiopsis sp. EMB25]|uniref:hypothetical protein n=1 Tax=Nocardiopsis sp. EMB25 TaxID=2835867 RepID=UPI002284A08E|nr:hypothetical protein [Nocardiopsis sp. EMB25]MCY9783593.1 hypothetical protein [Nocardiopsis sp. EMB25]
MPHATFRDESPRGERLATFDLPDLPERITVREVIRLRVREEVARHNADPTPSWRGLVTPTRAEQELNGRPDHGARPRIDWEKQADRALEAFSRQGFVVIVGDRQAQTLEETVDLTADPEIVFIKLVPLVGG